MATRHRITIPIPVAGARLPLHTPAPDMRMTFWELLRWQPPGPAQPATRGGISLSPTTMVRTPGGGVRFQSDLPEDAEFLLVTPIFGFQLR